MKKCITSGSVAKNRVAYSGICCCWWYEVSHAHNNHHHKSQVLGPKKNYYDDSIASIVCKIVKPNLRYLSFYLFKDVLILSRPYISYCTYVRTYIFTYDYSSCTKSNIIEHMFPFNQTSLIINISIDFAAIN